MPSLSDPPGLRSLSDDRWLLGASREELNLLNGAVWERALDAAMQVRGWIQDLRPAPASAEESFERIEGGLQRIVLAEREIRLGVDPRAHARHVVAAWRSVQREHGRWADGSFVA